MKRFACMALVLVASVVAPLVAQSPAGWKLRVDRSTSATDPDASGSIKFMAMGNGFHTVAPQAATYWKPGNAASGAYVVKGTFTLVEPSNHTNYYGLVFGGSALEGSSQEYTYFVIAQNGSFMVKKRNGDATQDVVTRAMHDAIKKPDASGKSVNALEVRVTADKVDYVVNGTVVHSAPKAGLKTDGIYGFRVNHMLNVQVDNLTKS